MSTYILFAGVICLIVLLSALLFMNGSYDYRVEQGLIDESTVVKPVKPEGMSPLESVVDSINIAVASQGFVIALFPIYSSMAREARPHIMKSISAALLFTMSTYTYLSFISISYFG
jgi:amino acid permease